MNEKRTVKSSPLTPAPMRVMRRWLIRERALRGGAALELDIVDRQITREEKAVASAVDEAARIEDGLQRVRTAFRAALCDRKTPGVIDCREARAIGRAIVGTRVAAHRHTTHLEDLS